MGHFIGMDDRQFYVHDDGRWYDTPEMRREYDPQTLAPVCGKHDRPAGQSEIEVQPEVEGGGTTVDSGTTCPECGFTAKNKNGLRLHMRKHGGK